jgi:hypothetical protein
MVENFESSFVSRYGFKGAVILTHMCHETRFAGKKNFTVLSLKSRFSFISEKQVRDAIKILMKEKGITVSQDGKKGITPRTIQYKVTPLSLKQYSCEIRDKRTSAGETAGAE